MLRYGVVLTKGTKVGMIRPNYNVTDGINFRAEAKRLTHKTMQKKHHVIFPGVNSAIITQVKVGLKHKYFSNI